LPIPTILNDNYQAPRTPLEEAIVAAFSEVLGINSIGITDNFFDLGGHSILATRVVARLRQALDFEVPIKSLFLAPTAASLAELLAIEGEDRQREALVDEIVDEISLLSDDELAQLIAETEGQS
jgi:acyl carrier protein